MQRTAPRRYETVAPRYAPVTEGLLGTGMRVLPELQTIAEEIGGPGTKIKNANLFSKVIKESAIEFNKFDLNTFMDQSPSSLRQGFAEKIQNPATLQDRDFVAVANKRGIEEAYDIYLGLVTQSQPEELKALLREHPTKWPDLLGGAEWGERLESPYVGLGSEGYLDPETGKFDVLRKNLDREKLLEGPQRPERLAERIIETGPTRGTVGLLASMLQGYAAAAGPVSYILGTIGGEVAHAKAREAGWPGWAQGTAQVAGAALGGLAGVIPEEQAIRAFANWTRSLTKRGPSLPPPGMPFRERWGVSGAGTKMSPTELAEKQFFASQSPEIRAALTQAAQEGVDPSQRIVAGGARPVVPEVAPVGEVVEEAPRVVEKTVEQLTAELEIAKKAWKEAHEVLEAPLSETVDGRVMRSGSIEVGDVKFTPAQNAAINRLAATRRQQQARFEETRDNYRAVNEKWQDAVEASDPAKYGHDAATARIDVWRDVDAAKARLKAEADAAKVAPDAPTAPAVARTVYTEIPTFRKLKDWTPIAPEDVKLRSSAYRIETDNFEATYSYRKKDEVLQTGWYVRLKIDHAGESVADWPTRFPADEPYIFATTKTELIPYLRQAESEFVAEQAKFASRPGAVKRLLAAQERSKERAAADIAAAAPDAPIAARVGVLTPEETGRLGQLKIQLAREEAQLDDLLTDPEAVRMGREPRPYSLRNQSLLEPGEKGYRPPAKPGYTEAERLENIRLVNEGIKDAEADVVAAKKILDKENLYLKQNEARLLKQGQSGKEEVDSLKESISEARTFHTEAKDVLADARLELRTAKKPTAYTAKEKALIAAADKWDVDYPDQLRARVKSTQEEIAALEAKTVAAAPDAPIAPTLERPAEPSVTQPVMQPVERFQLPRELAGQFDDTIEVPRFTEEPGVTLPAVAATGVDGFPITPKNVVAVSGKGGARFVAEKEPEVSLSQLQYMRDLAAGREAAKVVSGKVPPHKRPPGDPVGYNPDDPPPARSDVGIADILNGLPTDEAPSKATMRLLGGARNAAQLKIEVWFTDGMTLMKQLGIRIPDRESMLPIFRAMEGEISVDDLDPSLLPLFNHIKKFKDLEETDHLNFLNENIRVSSVFKEQDPESALALSLERTALDSEAFIARMSAHPDYMPRAWDVPGVTRKVGVIPRLIAGVIHKERPKFGRRASFQKPRIKATFSELLEWAESQGGSVASWNPMYAMAMRVLQGVEYREQIKILNRLRVLGRVVPESKMPDDGWRVPRNVGGAFESMPIATSKPGVVVYTPRLAVENRIADFLEEIYGIQPFDGANTIRKWSDRLKKNALMFSGFQHFDIGLRTLATAFSPTGIMRGAPVKLPSLAYRMIRASTQAGYRQKTARKLESTQVLFQDKDMAITFRDIAEQGTGIQGDLSIVERSLMDQLNEAAVMRGLGRAFGPLVKLKQGFETGLFSGIYREAQIFALQNYIIPWLRRTNPGYNATQIAAAASREVNIMFSSLGRWQTVLSNPTFRRITNFTFFSTNEAESILTGFGKAVSLPGTRNAGLYREWYAGLFIGLAFIGNLINLASKQRPLSPDQYIPIDFNDPYAPFGWGYNNLWLSPVAPFIKGPNGEDIYIDLVGQMDTAFRLLDPINFLTARYNLSPRALYNQVRAKSFFGEPLDTWQKKAGQLVSDILIPISGKGPVEILVEQERIPSAVTKIIDIPPGGEKSLGTSGKLIQSFGLNMRGESKSQTMLRSAQKLHPEIETLEELDPLQRYELPEKDPSLDAALRVKEEDAARRGSPFAKYSILRENLEKEKIAREAELLLKLQHTYASRKYPDESKYEAGSAKDIFLAWYAEYKSLQAEMFARMEGMRQGLGIDSYSGREARTPNEKILNEYYALQDEAKTPAGGFDTDKWVELRDSFFETLTEDKKEFIDKWRSRHEHAPGVEDLLKLFGHRVWFGTRWRIYHPQIIDILNKIERSELQDLIAQVQPSPESR